ncbi:MAG TPA: hypothetical protein VJV03_06200 [Pyrinomonadaceae bacterium]|nr:hypothetical protein [Pyrinomonadaceae bacterium]
MSITTEVAEVIGSDEELVIEVISEFVLQLHRHALEYRGMNGDFIGEELRTHIPPQAFYHFLGFLDYFAERYDWEPGSASEYLMRLGLRDDWSPYRDQMKGWHVARRLTGG